MAPHTGPVAAVVLAAGRGTRVESKIPKPLLGWRGRPLVAWALDAALDSGLRPVVLVVGHAAGAVTREARAGVSVVKAPRWRQGIAWSLRAALDALEGWVRVEGVCVGLADQPLVGAEAFRRVAAVHASGAPLGAATYGGQRANPVYVGRGLWGAARALSGDEGARALMHDLPVVDVPCDDTGRPDDIDTLDDLAGLDSVVVGPPFVAPGPGDGAGPAPPET